MQRIKVYLADDHTLFRKSLVKLLSEFRRVGEIKDVSNGLELLALIKKDIPDVVILDLEMPVLDGTKTCEKLIKEYPEVKIIIVSMHDSKILIGQLLRRGAHAFLPKNTEPEEMEKAILALVDKGVYRNVVMNEALKYSKHSSSDLIKVKTINDVLSPKEKVILDLICKQLNNKQIGKELSLSENTIRNHKVRIMKKTGMKNTPGLVKYVYENMLQSKNSE